MFSEIVVDAPEELAKEQEEGTTDNLPEEAPEENRSNCCGEGDSSHDACGDPASVDSGVHDVAAQQVLCASQFSRRIATYEGIFQDVPEDKSSNDPEMACIEAHALSCHEVLEHLGGHRKLVGVRRGSWRFHINVAPFFKPKGCTVQLLSDAPQKTPALGRRAPKKRKLEWVDTGPSFGGRDPFCSVWEMPQQIASRCRPVGARSKTASLALPLLESSSPLFGSGMGCGGGLRGLHGSASLPALTRVCGPSSKSEAGQGWKDFYRPRSDSVISKVLETP